MRARSGLKRVAAVYAVIEGVREAEVQMAASALQEAELAGAVTATMLEASRKSAHAALSAGNLAEWQIAKTAGHAEMLRIDWLEKVKLEREHAWRSARAEHRVIQLEMHKVEAVMDEARRIEVLEQERRQQADSDDRFAARRAWLMRGELLRNMNAR